MRHLSLFIPYADWNEAIRQQVETMGDVLRAAGLSGEIILLSLADESQNVPVEISSCDEAPHIDIRPVQIRHVEIHRPRTYSSALLSGTEVAQGEFVIHLPAAQLLPVSGLKSLMHHLIQQDLVMVAQTPPRPAWDLTGWIQRRLGSPPQLDVSSVVWGARREALAELPHIQGLSRGLPLLVRTLGFRVAQCLPHTIGGQPDPSSPLADCWSWKDWAGHRWLEQRWAQVDYTEAERTAGILPDLRVAFFESQSRRKAG